MGAREKIFVFVFFLVGGGGGGGSRAKIACKNFAS